MKYQGRNWHGHLQVEQELPEFFAVCLTCDSDSNMTVDVNVHVLKTASCLTLSLFSPYWLINKTSRVLQYQADELSLKHPADLRDIVLFSFRKKNLFSKSKVRPGQDFRTDEQQRQLDSCPEFSGCDLMVIKVLCSFLQLQLRVSTSSWSDPFSLDTVGSYGCVRCPANNMDFLVRSRSLLPCCQRMMIRQSCAVDFTTAGSLLINFILRATVKLIMINQDHD